MYTIFVLGQLLDGAMTGYRLREILPNIIGQREKVSYGIIHSLLQRLALSGDITLETTVSAGNRPQKIAHITNQGRQTFLKLMHAPIKDGKHEELQYLFKLNNLHHVPATDGARIVRQFIDFNQSVLDEAQANADGIMQNDHMNAGEKKSATAIAQYTEARARMAIDWAKTL